MATQEQLIKWCGGKWLMQHDLHSSIEVLCIDSRSIDRPEQTLFIALKTNLRDGHLYIEHAYKQGVRNFLVSVIPATFAPKDSNIILVEDTLAALQQIGAGHRSLFQYPVLGITGSNGKTVVKEWLYQLLCDEYQIVRSPKSYNSQIGVPLSVWQMSHEHNLGLFEAGISVPGEMARLTGIIQPDTVIFTNIGAAHSEGFENKQQKVVEKLKLAVHANCLIYCKDHEAIDNAVNMHGNGLRSDIRLFTWSRKMDADLKIMQVETINAHTIIHAIYNGQKYSVTIPFADDTAVENAMQCWCYLLVMGIAPAVIAARMKLLHPVSMRMELRHAINDCTLINDTYSSDLTSLKLALNYLDQQQQHSRHTVILSDMLQTGTDEPALYAEVAALLARHHVSRVIGIGPAFRRNKEVFQSGEAAECLFYDTTESFLQNFHHITFSNEAILLKGARVFAFEKIGFLLEQQVHQTVMQIDLSALRDNLNVFRALLDPGVKTMAMVKAFAYGSGSYEIASMLQYAGVNYLTVAYTDEGIELRRAGITMPIMVMSPDISSFSRMIAWKLEPELYNFRSMTTFIHYATTLGEVNYPVHLKLDTGMHRLGFAPEQIPELIATISETNAINVASIFSHLAASDDAKEDAYTLEQAARFESMSKQLITHLRRRPLLHLCNSAGIARHPALHYDMVRLGIGLYGEDSGHVLAGKLKQITTLKTVIAQITHVGAGENIGYGHTTIAATDMRIATICIGYADGYPRALGNGKAWVLIHGKQARVTGNICMDMCMVDVTAIPEAVEGDEVVIMGADLTAAQLATWAGTIAYEVMTGISQRVKRVYINEQ